MRSFIAPSLALVLAACGAATAQESENPNATVEAPSGSYVNDLAHTSVHWKIHHMGLSDYTSRINDVQIELDFDASDIENSSVRATIDAASFDTFYPRDDKDFNAEIASPLIMNAEEFSTITFESTQVTKTSPTTADIVGDLTMMGITKSVTLIATYHGSTAEHVFAKVPAIGFNAHTTIDRTEFGNTFLVEEGILGKEVTIQIEAEFIQESP